MIQAKPFASSSFALGPQSSPSTASVVPTSLMSSLSVGNNGKVSARRPAQATSFGLQNGSLFSQGNSNITSTQATFSPLTGTSHDTSSTSSTGQSRSGLSSSFFPSSPFPFSVNSHGSIDSISHSTASTNGITSSISSNLYAKNPSISAQSGQPGPAPGTSNFFPNSGEDASNFIPLRVSNLPRDIKEQEFNVLFTFAPEYVFSEIQKAKSIAEDGLPSSVVGIGYFKSLSAASNALAVLTCNPLVFLPKDIAAQSGNTSPSPYAIKCEIPYNRYQNFSGAPGQSAQTANVQASQNGPFKSSRFVFPSSVSTSGNLGNSQLEITSPTSFPEMYSEGVSNGGVFSPTTSGGLFPSTTDNDYTRMTGKSLLLESQGKEDEEYNDLVKGPWLSQNGSGYPIGAPVNPPGPVGSQSHQAPIALPTTSTSQRSQSVAQPPPSTPSTQTVSKSQQNSQASSRAQSPPSSSNSSTSSHTSQSSAVSKAPGRVASSSVPGISQTPTGNGYATPNAWTDKRRSSTTRSFQNLSINGNAPSADGSKLVVPYSPTNGGTAIHIMQNGGRVLPPANPADQNPPCNTLYVGNLPPDTNEEELKELFSSRRGYKRLCFRTKANGPMCFVEFEDVSWATRALEELYGFGLSNSVKGGIRLSFSKNPLGVRSQVNSHSGNNSNGGNGNNSPAAPSGHHQSRIGSQQAVGVNGYSIGSRVGSYTTNSNDSAANQQQRQQQQPTYHDANSTSNASGYLPTK